MTPGDGRQWKAQIASAETGSLPMLNFAHKNIALRKTNKQTKFSVP